MQRREDGGGGHRQEAACKVHALGMASCMPICHTLLFSFGFLQKLGNTQAAAVSGSLILGFLALLYFFFWLFASTQLSTLKQQALQVPTRSFSLRQLFHFQNPSVSDFIFISHDLQFLD